MLKYVGFLSLVALVLGCGSPDDGPMDAEGTWALLEIPGSGTCGLTNNSVDELVVAKESSIQYSVTLPGYPQGTQLSNFDIDVGSSRTLLDLTATGPIDPTTSFLLEWDLRAERDRSIDGTLAFAVSGSTNCWQDYTVSGVIE